MQTADFGLLLKLVNAAQGDRVKLSLAAVDTIVATAPEDVRDDLRRALDAAAILHWFDRDLLAATLDPDLAPDAAGWFDALCQLPFVERFPARGESARNLREDARLAWRARLHRQHPERFATLGARAAAAVHAMLPESPLRQIEALYLRLPGLSRREGADAIEALDRVWTRALRTSEQQMLAQALEELSDAGLLSGLARAAALLQIAVARFDYQPLDTTRELIDLAYELSNAAGHRLWRARAQQMQGEVLHLQGRGDEAIGVLSEALDVQTAWLTVTPDDIETRRQRGVTWLSLARVYHLERRWAEARTHYELARDFFTDLARIEPGAPAHLQSRAIAWMGIGHAQAHRENWRAALDAFDQARVLTAKLVDDAPDDAGRRRALALASAGIGMCFARLRLAHQALHQFETCLAIFEPLATRDAADAAEAAGSPGADPPGADPSGADPPRADQQGADVSDAADVAAGERLEQWFKPLVSAQDDACAYAASIAATLFASDASNVRWNEALQGVPIVLRFESLAQASHDATTKLIADQKLTRRRSTGDVIPGDARSEEKPSRSSKQ